VSAQSTSPAERAGGTSPFPIVLGLGLGLDTFGHVTDDPAGRPLSHAQTIRDLVEQGVTADESGVDFFRHRFDLRYGMGGLAHEALLTNIRLYGTEVVPRIRALLAPRLPAGLDETRA
jgi:hypothetical protein